MNHLCFTAPVSIGREPATPVVGKSPAQECQSEVDASNSSSVSYGSEPSLSAQVSSVGSESDKASATAATVNNEFEDSVAEPRDSKVFGGGGGGGGVVGILYKWVNYCKGWRSRWFVLEDGVLSYYRVDGPDKILMSPAREKSLRVIGEDSLMYMKKANWSGNRLVGDSAWPCKPFDEVHLKDSSIRASKADDKKLSIFTWTKTLHLRCMSIEDRAVWIEALVAAKDVFPRVLTSSDFRPSKGIAVSTEKLRLRLQQEGIGEAVIKDCESIMLSETSELQNQMKAMKALQHKHALLLDTSRQLETQKIELETNVVDETKEQESYCGQDKSLFAVAGGATDGIFKLSEPDKADIKNNSNAGDFIKTPETVLPSAASTSSTHSFGKTPGGVSLKNGSSASASSNPVVFSNLTSQNSSISSLFTNDGSNTASIMTATTPTPASSNSSVSTSTPAPSGPAASVSKFVSSTPSTAAAPFSETSSSSAASLLKLSTDSTTVAPISETSSAPAEPVKFASSTTLTAAAPVVETSTAPVAPEFEFGYTVASSAFAPVSQTSDVISEAIKMKQDTSFGMPRTVDDDKFTAEVNGIDSRNQKVNDEDSTPPKKDAVSGPETLIPSAQNSVAYHPQKKWAFQMSVPEEFLDSDDDSYPNGEASDALAEGSEKVDLSSAEGKSSSTEYVTLEKASAMTEIRPACLK